MLKIININKLNDSSFEELSSKLPKKTFEAIQILVEFENSPSIRLNSALLEYQNTNYENYQWILKDFINEVNISTNMITESIKEVFNNAKEFIVDNPNLFEHTIIYNKDTNIIESESVKEYYIDYLNYVNELGHKASNFLKLYDFELYAEFNKKMLFSPGSRCMIDANNQLVKYDKDVIYKDSYKEKRASIIVDYGKRIYSLIDRHKDFIDDETLKALEFFSCSDGKNRKWYINSALYASNLYDEKIIPKYAQVHFYNVGQKDFEIVSLDSVKVTSKGRTFSYSYACSFDISYYLRKYLIETYTKKDMFSFMCLYKDFLSHYDYLNFKDKNDFNQEHPMIQEANLISDIESIAIKFDKRLSGYVAVLSDIEKTNQEALFVSKPIKEWVDLLNFPDKTKNYFYGKFQINKEPTIDEFKEVINNYANSIKEFEISKILDNDSKKEIYKNIKKVRVYFDEVIDNILTKIYNSQLEDVEGNELDISRFFNKRDAATFHTTLKESIVIDCRTLNDIIINDGAKKLLDEEKLKRLSDVLHQSKYHDYIEIDKDIFDKESVLTVDDIINLIEKTNSFNLPVNIKTALKFRKLKQYKATGIYFSFSKQLGLDFRDGFGAYMHEVAHHIDLSSENYNRNCMVNYLYEYFCNKITDRVDYYLKSEELIARAAEISLLLLLGRYEKFKEMYDKNEIDETTLVRAVNDTFLKTSYSNFMGTLSVYKLAQYFDYEAAILNRDFKSIDYLLVYFKSFWSGKMIDVKDESRLPSNTNVNHDNEKKFAKKSELSYNYFYRNIFKNKINF